jgi:hypothetical protein
MPETLDCRCVALKEDWHSSQGAGSILLHCETAASHSCRLSVDLNLFLSTHDVGKRGLSETFKERKQLNYATGMEAASASLKSGGNGASKLFHS